MAAQGGRSNENNREDSIYTIERHRVDCLAGPRPDWPVQGEVGVMVSHPSPTDLLTSWAMMQLAARW